MHLLSRLYDHWVYGGALAGVMLLGLAPLLTAGLSPAGALVYLALAAYMLHQYEEHDDDRFRIFVNTVLLKGREGLTKRAVFVINIFGVWAVLALTLWVTERVAGGWAMIAAYLLIINGAAHLAQAVIMRRSNPGVWTGAAVFLPFGGWIVLQLAEQTSLLHHVLSLGLVLALHALIVVAVRRT